MKNPTIESTSDLSTSNEILDLSLSNKEYKVKLVKSGLALDLDLWTNLPLVAIIPTQNKPRAEYKIAITFFLKDNSLQCPPTIQIGDIVSTKRNEVDQIALQVTINTKPIINTNDISHPTFTLYEFHHKYINKKPKIKINELQVVFNLNIIDLPPSDQPRGTYTIVQYSN